MASNTDLVQYVVDQCADAGEITARKMFVDYGIYCHGKILGLICDNRLYIKPTEAGRRLPHKEDLRAPYDGAKDYFYIAAHDYRQYLASLVKATCNELPAPKPKKRKSSLR